MRPILFNTEMVQAIMRGDKTVTRRVVKPQPEITPIPTFGGSYRVSMEKDLFIRPPYRTGDILYVRETWQQNYDGSYAYRAGHKFEKDSGWRPSIHMPKEAARIFLRVKSVRVERLQDITEDDAAAEGTLPETTPNIPGKGKTYVQGFGDTWNSTIKPADRTLYGWAANPWVWVIEFKRISKEKAMRDD